MFLQFTATVFDNIEDTILLVGIEADKTYRLLMANAAFGRGSGHITEKSIGKLVSEIVSPESYKVLVKWYEKVIKIKKPLNVTAWMNVPLGLQAFDIKMIPILNTMGECVQIAVITHNITEVLKLRAELKDLQAKQASQEG